MGVIQAFVLVKGAVDSGRLLFGKKRIEMSAVREHGVNYTVMMLQKPELINHPKVRSQLSGRPLLLNEGIKSVCNWNYIEISSIQYENELFQNGTRLLLNGLAEHFRKKTAALIDIKGRYQKLADCLTEHFSSVRIITACPELYQYYVDEKLYECGAALSVSDRFSLKGDIACCFSPDGIVCNEMYNNKIRVFLPRKSDFSGKYAVHSFKAELPQGLLKQVDNDTDEHLFACALYKYCGLRIPELLLPTRVMIDNEDTTIDKAKINLFSLDTD